jgi:hypothetical protein
VSATRWALLACLAVFLLTALRSLAGAARARGDLAVPKGKASVGIAYSFTGGMAPWKKESARRHLAVYALGVAYHLGTFLAFLWLALLAIGVGLPAVLKSLSAMLLGATALAGIVLLVRRIADSNLRYFSSPDDYFANAVVTGFQALAATALLRPGATGALLVYGGLLLVYIPVGKLKHSLYFGPARYYLGLFYGRRGVWSDEGGARWRSERP